MSQNFELRAVRPKNRRIAPFTEEDAWLGLGKARTPVHGDIQSLGYSFEWHDFTPKQDFQWSRTFHPDSIEICLNLSGNGQVSSSERTLKFGPATAGFYLQTQPLCLKAVRQREQRHQFMTLGLSIPFLTMHFTKRKEGLHAGVAAALTGKRRLAEVSESIHLTVEQQQMISSLQSPPVYASAHGLWYQAKALELAAALLYGPSDEEELFCERVKRLNQDRSQKVIQLLKQNLSAPPSLKEIGQRVGCSYFYLSRLFAQVTGKTISAYLRELRMQRAAALLREGRLNVTEVAFEVGYSSPSHFTVAFRQTFNCCPGLYPRRQ